jgi:hypothetical protein
MQREHLQAALREEDLKRRRLAEDARRSGGVYGRAELDAAEREEGEDAIEAAILTALMGHNPGDIGGGTAGALGSSRRSVRHLVLPSAEEVRAAVVEERKRRLLDQMS